MKPIVKGDAQSLMKVLEEVVIEWELEPDNFVGLSTDGASPMIGVHNSLQALARKKYKNLVHLRCPAHSIDLAAKDAMKALPAYIEFMVTQELQLV